MVVDWGDVPTWVSSAAAIGALVFAVKAYRTSAGSLQAALEGLQVERERDRQREEQEVRAQAALVAAVTAREQVYFEVEPGDRRWDWFPAVEVINRSDLPVFGVEVLWPERSGVGTVRPGDSRTDRLPWQAVADVAEEIEGMAHLFEDWPGGEPPTVELQDAALSAWERYGSCEIAFSDAAGRRWRRDAAGKLWPVGE